MPSGLTFFAGAFGQHNLLIFFCIWSPIVVLKVDSTVSFHQALTTTTSCDKFDLLRRINTLDEQAEILRRLQVGKAKLDLSGVQTI